MTTARSTACLLLLLACLTGTALAGDQVSYSAQAQTLLQGGDPDQAVEVLKKGFSLFPYDLQLKAQLAGALSAAGELKLKQNRYSEAADSFSQAKELFPQRGDFGFMRGIALYLGKDYDGARTEFQEAGDVAPALIYLGKISYDTGDLPGALALWRRAKEKDPDNQSIQALIDKAERELPVENKMDKGYSSMFDLSFDAELPPGLSAEVLDALESAYNTVCADLNYFPTTRVPVLLYTKSDYRSVTAGPDWSGGLYDGKIRLPVGNATTLTKQMRAVIFHEFTHVVIAEITRNNIPTWLNEGLAEIEGRREFGHPTVELSRAAKEDKVIPLSFLSGSFMAMNGNEAGLAYQESYSVANFLVSRYGWYAVQEILKNLRERNSIDDAVAKALSSYSMDLTGVMREWRDSLK